MLRFALLFSALTLGSATVWGQSVPDVQRTLNSDVQRTLTSSAATATEQPDDLASIREFYQQRGQKLAWHGATQDIPADRLLLDIQSIATAEGLQPDQYVLPPGGSDTERDVMLTAVLLRFGRDVSIGHVTPSRPMGGMGTEIRPDFAETKFLKSVSQHRDLLKAVEEVIPPYAGYQRLKLALQRARALARAGGWQTIPEGPSIKADMDDPRVALIRKRLIATGELAPNQDQGTRLDAPLMEAVKRFQIRHGIEPDGFVGRHTLQTMNVSAEDRVKQIMVNLERWRWMPRSLDPHHIAVNIPAAHLELVRSGEIRMQMRVVVGDLEHQTPTMATAMTSLVLNPTWTVPPNIATKELLPKLHKNPRYLAENNMRILDAFPDGSQQASGIGVDWHKFSKLPYRIRQSPGPDNALGQVKFSLSNSDDIYLHDTPKRQYFGRIFRALSHGCVRLEHPIALARAVVAPEWADKIEPLIAETSTKTLRLERTMTVYLMYMTAWADETGAIQYRDDIYGHDGRVRNALKGKKP